MNSWKKVIFVNAIKSRMRNERRTAENIMVEYTKLTDEEKIQILQTINIQ